MAVTVEDGEPHRISLELEDEDEDEEPFVMETEELKSRMDKSHMPEAHPFEPEENAVWASRDPDVNEQVQDGASERSTAEEEDAGDDVMNPEADPEQVRQKAFERVAELLREKGRSEEWIEEHEDAIWGRVDEILAE